MFMFRQRILLCDSGNPIATDKMKNAIPTLHLAPIALHVRPEDALLHHGELADFEKRLKTIRENGSGRILFMGHIGDPTDNGS
jgi:hypothetical protein